jgi:hypothetical protein
MTEAPVSRVNVKKLVEHYGELSRLREPWLTLWQDIALYVTPRRYPGMCGTILAPDTSVESRLFDTTAIQAHQTNANGCLAWMTPQESTWFAYTPPATLKDDAAKQWTAKATQISRDTLARSNFYLAVHEFYMDRSAFGTAAIYGEPDEKEPVTFQHWPVGTFVVGEDHKGRVDTVVREFKLTATQAVEKFGQDKVSEKIQKAYAAGGAKAMQTFEFLHFIMPRKEKDRTKGSFQQRMPIACYYVEKDGQHLCKESGYNEMPVFVSRYLEWGTGTGGVYGWAPAFSALPEARQVNFMQKMMDALAEKIAFPPWLVPEELEGEVDGNAGGVTYFSKDLQPHQMPREMPPQGRYDVGKDRVIERQNAIKAAFHVDMFQMFSSMERTAQMTAREVAERSSEKLVQFSPTFARLTTEMTNPLLEWLFSTLLVQGAFGSVESVPAALQVQVKGGVFIAPPSVEYSSRIALALRALPTVGLWRTLELAGAIAQATGSPEVMDNFDFDEAIRAGAINDGVSADIIVPKHVVDARRTARAQAQAEAMQMQQAALMADAAGKVGNIKPDSVIGQQMKGAAA